MQDLLHRSPREFDIDRGIWTLEIVARVCTGASRYFITAVSDAVTFSAASTRPVSDHAPGTPSHWRISLLDAVHQHDDPTILLHLSEPLHVVFSFAHRLQQRALRLE
ncbi:MAG TPA: hypothetical protein VGF67_04080 [Ktedonobacteraceae bacterium]